MNAMKTIYLIFLWLFVLIAWGMVAQSPVEWEMIAWMHASIITAVALLVSYARFLMEQDNQDD